MFASGNCDCDRGAVIRLRDQRSEVSAAAPKPAATSVAQPVAITRVPDEGLMVTGPLIVEHQVDITAQRDGIVSRISAEAGTHVASGTVLAQLDDRQLTSNLEALARKRGASKRT